MTASGAAPCSATVEPAGEGHELGGSAVQQVFDQSNFVYTVLQYTEGAEHVVGEAQAVSNMQLAQHRDTGLLHLTHAVPQSDGSTQGQLTHIMQQVLQLDQQMMDGQHLQAHVASGENGQPVLQLLPQQLCVRVQPTESGQKRKYSQVDGTDSGGLPDTPGSQMYQQGSDGCMQPKRGRHAHGKAKPVTERTYQNWLNMHPWAQKVGESKDGYPMVQCMICVAGKKSAGTIATLKGAVCRDRHVLTKHEQGRGHQEALAKLRRDAPLGLQFLTAQQVQQVVPEPSTSLNQELGALLLRYLQLPNNLAGRGGAIRFYLLTHNVAFEEEVIPMEDWPAHKQDLIESGHNPTGHVPVLYVNGRPLTEHVAILRRLSRLLHEYGPDIDLDYTVDRLAESVCEWRDAWSRAHGLPEDAPDYKSYMSERPKFYSTWNTLLQRHNSLGSAVVGGQSSYVDCLLFAMLWDDAVCYGTDQLATCNSLYTFFECYRSNQVIHDWCVRGVDAVSATTTVLVAEMDQETLTAVLNGQEGATATVVTVPTEQGLQLQFQIPSANGTVVRHFPTLASQQVLHQDPQQQQQPQPYSIAVGHGQQQNGAGLDYSLQPHGHPGTGPSSAAAQVAPDALQLPLQPQPAGVLGSGIPAAQEQEHVSHVHVSDQNVPPIGSTASAQPYSEEPDGEQNSQKGPHSNPNVDTHFQVQGMPFQVHSDPEHVGYAQYQLPGIAQYGVQCMHPGGAQGTGPAGEMVVLPDSALAS